MKVTSDYRRAYEAAQRELVNLLEQQDTITKRIVIVRQNIQGLAQLCESENVPVAPSPEAEYLLAHSSLPDEITNILKSEHPEWLRPADLKKRLEDLGHDMRKYSNPLATIHMVLKRLVDANKVRDRVHAQGFKVYQYQVRTMGQRMLSIAKDAK